MTDIFGPLPNSKFNNLTNTIHVMIATERIGRNKTVEYVSIDRTINHKRYLKGNLSTMDAVNTLYCHRIIRPRHSMLSKQKDKRKKS